MQLPILIWMLTFQIEQPSTQNADAAHGTIVSYCNHKGEHYRYLQRDEKLIAD